MSASFKKGQPVRFRTAHGRTGTGKIAEVTKTAKGDWFSVKSEDGTVTKVRAAGLTAS